MRFRTLVRRNADLTSPARRTGASLDRVLPTRQGPPLYFAGLLPRFPTTDMTHDTCSEARS